MVARRRSSAPVQTCTRFRSNGESTNLNTYVPGSRTCPGISTGSVNVTVVFSSKGPALDLVAVMAQRTTAQSEIAKRLKIRMSFPPDTQRGNRAGEADWQ